MKKKNSEPPLQKKKIMEPINAVSKEIKKSPGSMFQDIQLNIISAKDLKDVNNFSKSQMSVFAMFQSLAANTTINSPPPTTTLTPEETPYGISSSISPLTNLSLTRIVSFSKSNSSPVTNTSHGIQQSAPSPSLSRNFLITLLLLATNSVTRLGTTL